MKRDFPTAVAPFDEFRAAAPTAKHARSALERMRGRGGHPSPSRALVAEAKEALGAIVAGEQVYYQKWGTLTDVPATADFGAILGIYFGDLLRRWEFSVRDASVTGFLANAQGRDHTDAEGSP